MAKKMCKGIQFKFVSVIFYELPYNQIVQIYNEIYLPRSIY